jgi:hypothetical protein
VKDADLSGCPDGLLPIVMACLRPHAQRPSAEALLSALEAAAGPVPRDWLPPAVTSSFADYQDLPGRAGASRWRLGLKRARR